MAKEMPSNKRTILILTLSLYACVAVDAKMIRNSDLMNRMMSNFQRDNPIKKKLNAQHADSIEWPELRQPEDTMQYNAASEKDTDAEGWNDQYLEQEHKALYDHDTQEESPFHETPRQEHIEQIFQQSKHFIKAMQKSENQREQSQEKYQNPKEPQDYNDKRPADLVQIMKNILCKHFPTIPCHLILKDESLSGLIEKSIKQIMNKQHPAKDTTKSTSYHHSIKVFPTVNSEDLSSFLEVRDPTTMYRSNRSPNENLPNEYVHRTKAEKIRAKQFQQMKRKNHQQQKGEAKVVADQSGYYKGRKKLRKFYPRKYKDAAFTQDGYKESNEDKISMSLERIDPGMGMNKRKRFLRSDDERPGFWRMDYLKQGDPSLTRAYSSNLEDPFNAELKKMANHVMLDKNIGQAARRGDILHPDLYIKRNMGRNKR